jgi:hypothetical protein
MTRSMVLIRHLRLRMFLPWYNAFNHRPCSNLRATSLVVCSRFLTVRTRDPMSIDLTERHSDTRASQDVRIGVVSILP